jgi:hypothetical protein
VKEGTAGGEKLESSSSLINCCEAGLQHDGSSIQFMVELGR